jgi:hypothetical protein
VTTGRGGIFLRNRFIDMGAAEQRPTRLNDWHGILFFEPTDFGGYSLNRYGSRPA